MNFDDPFMEAALYFLSCNINSVSVMLLGISLRANPIIDYDNKFIEEETFVVEGSIFVDTR